MRKYIKSVEKLFEMPSLMAGTIDFGLENEELNQRMSRYCLDNTVEIIETGANFQIGRCGTQDSGVLYLFNKKDNSLDYYVEYAAYQYPVLGRLVTQIALWRNLGVGAIYKNLTAKMFFDVLLARYDGVMSDVEQSYDGKRFWIDRLIEARALGYTVGLRTPKGDIVCDQNNVRKWAEGLDAWKEDSPEHAEKRFFIVKK